MPEARIQSTVANARIGYGTPNARVSAFQTGRTGDRAIIPGMPIGLLLALTYAEAYSTIDYGDQRPNVRIRTN